MALSIEMTSELYGSALFRYDTEDERVAGLMHLMRAAERAVDGVPRDYYFGEADDDNQIGDGVELAARWTGVAWETAEYGVPACL